MVPNMERGPFQKFVFNVGRPGEILVDGVKIENLAKRVKIPPKILDDLEFLAIEAFADEADSSEDGRIAGMPEKYPNEQPKEVWRREIAGLVRLGVTAEDIASALCRRNEKLMTSLNLGSLPPERMEKVINVLRSRIQSHWPSVKNRA